MGGPDADAQSTSSRGAGVSGRRDQGRLRRRGNLSGVGAVHYRVVKRVGGHRAHRQGFSVAADTTRRFWVKKPRGATATVVLKVKRPSGKWAQLDRVRVPRCR